MADKVCDAELIFSLRKSKVRQIVLEYLVSIYLKKSYPSEIARETGLGINEVYGALNGVSNRYKKENSLVNLNLVKKERKDNICVYHATDLGCKTCRLLIG